LAYEQSRKAAYDRVKQAVPNVNDAVQLLAEHYQYNKGIRDDGTPMFGVGVVNDIPEFNEGRKWLYSKVYRD
jgi:tetrahydromethanopterin S-methyltransferase subunit F